MRNPLQDQLLKAGLVKKAKVNQVVREQAKQRHGKAPVAPSDAEIQAQRLQKERAERDRALAAERKAQSQAGELRAQLRQIIDAQKLPLEGELAYRFNDGAAIRTIYVTLALRAQLASGRLVVVRDGDSHALLPRATAEKVRERDASLIVLDHGTAAASSQTASDDDAHYAQFEVPDDLTW